MILEWKLGHFEQNLCRKVALPSNLCGMTKFLSSEYQLYICSHILFKMEDEWIHDLSQGVYGAWELLHKETNKFHPELTLII